MKRALIMFGVVIAAAWLGAAEATHTFSVENGRFQLDGKPFVIRCGEIHLARVAPDYWRHRLQMIRACGFNSVCAYLFWNYHEQEEGKFDFAGDRDIARFCRIAQEEGLWVVLRPGPYTCAEWDSGGHPWWLLSKEGIRMRSRDPKYLEPAKRYLAAVGGILAPLQITKGGPILMVQAENEYGSYGDDGEYMREIYRTIRASGFEVPVFACNARGCVSRGAIPELVQVVNFGSAPAAAFAELRKISPESPLMCGEFYPAWFDSWGQIHHVKSADDCLRDLEYMLQHQASFSMYMAHGGTTFGWWAGCNAPFAPEVSSYDYDAPVSEAGWAHPTKFAALRELFGRYLNEGETIPEPPAAIPVQQGECDIAAEVADIRDFDGWSGLPSEPSPKTFEQLGIGYGVVVYRAELPAGVGGLLKADVRDLGIVRINGREIGFLDRRYPEEDIEIAAAAQPRGLEIVVEPMGRYNFGEMLHQGMKGIVGEVTVGGRKVTGWRMHGVSWDEMPKLRFRRAQDGERIGRDHLPACRLYRFNAKLEGGKDTFLDLSGWKRGMVWLNGRALGRYWSIGPTQTCYAPGCWIKDGDNQIVIWDAVGAAPKDAKFRWREQPVLDAIALDNDYYEKPLRKVRVGLEAWKGAKVAFLGDSITDPIHVGCRRNYWNFLIDDLALDAKIYGINGDNWKGVPNQVNRIHEAMQNDLDAIFIFMGTNDYMGDVPLGDFFVLKDEETNRKGKMKTLKRRYFNEDTSTFKGRINVALKKIKTEFPEAQVILMTPIHRAFFTCSPTNVQPPESFPNALGLYVDEYVEAIKEAGRIWSCPVIDLHGESGLLPENDSYVRYFANSKTDRLHPNSAGHRRLADLIEAKLNALPATFRR